MQLAYATAGGWQGPLSFLIGRSQTPFSPNYPLSYYTTFLLTHFSLSTGLTMAPTKAYDAATRT